jgi:hypothetical protein
MASCPVRTPSGGPLVLHDLLAVAIGVACFAALYFAINLIDRT